MPAVHVTSSNALTPSFLRKLRTLLESAYEGDFTDDDWAHAVGGVHVWVSGPDDVMSHASLALRTLVCAGQTLRVGYVEAVATAPAYRCNGHGTMVMRRIGALIREQYALGVLSTGAHAFFEMLGWERWRGASYVAGPHGLERTPDDDAGIMILRTPRSLHLDLDGDIVADWRTGDVW